MIGPQYYRVYPGGELYEDIKKDWNYTTPESLEKWVERYNKPENKFGFIDSGLKYPWITNSTHFLASNAAFITDFAYDGRFKFIDSYKKTMLNMIRPLVLLRIRHNFFYFPVDLKLAKAIYEFSIWDMLENSSTFTFIKKTKLYKSIRSTRMFEKFVKIFC